MFLDFSKREGPDLSSRFRRECYNRSIVSTRVSQHKEAGLEARGTKQKESAEDEVEESTEVVKRDYKIDRNSEVSHSQSI